MSAPTDDELNALAIPWRGGEQPVPDDVLVYIKLTSGWWPTPEPAENWIWVYSDITAYVPASLFTADAGTSRKENERLVN